MTALKIAYLANILVAGWVGISALFLPKTAAVSVFSNAFDYSESFRLVGAFWTTIFILSIIGLFFPKEMCLVLIFQVLYKSIWLIVAAFPAILNGQPYPKEMAVFFLIWVVALPWVIPWKEIFAF
ncbi:MAG: hypothetical protein AAF502_15080 [Bacteroidota bacterium]